ncbi:MAG: phage Gp37/Gp68 family protein [Muribaculaceae bacterium]|nr:phage Gp37/Gp68 family protein [Muribaculaceae bacterium]
MPMWNPWHGCHKISQGCRHCYVFREDAAFGTALSSDTVRKTSSFELPLRRDRKQNLKFPAGTEFALCFTSDFLIEEADEWRARIWEIIRLRADCRFFFITKRIDRLVRCLPPDWHEGYDNVAIGCTVENQKMADYRMPLFMSLPIRHRLVIVAPMLERVDLSAWLDPAKIESVSVGGESGKYARPLDYGWVLDLRQQCINHRVSFNFHQTGSYLVKDGRLYTITRQYQHSQAAKANINFDG